MSAAAKAVQAGIDWFEQNGFEDWADRIDLETLNMSSSTHCAAGQVLGDYDNLEIDHGMDIEERSACGFTAAMSGVEFYELTDEWKRRITEKRSSTPLNRRELADDVVNLGTMLDAAEADLHRLTPEYERIQREHAAASDRVIDARAKYRAAHKKLELR